MEPDGLFNLSRGGEALPSFGGRAGPAVEGVRPTLGRHSDATRTPLGAVLG